MHIELSGWQDALISGGALVVAVLIGVLLHKVSFRLLAGMAARTDTRWDDIIVKRIRGPASLLLPLLVVLVVTPSLQLSGEAIGLLRHVVALTFIGAVTWLLAAGTFVLRDRVLAGYDISARDNLRARAVHTQVDVLVKILLVAILFIGAASMLMTFEKVREIGVSLLASAGIAGIIIGFAAQKSLATLFAGIQIAITQPIRIDDVVIVEGEWGRIEEITLTYVVVRIWDLRRLVVPITYFIEKPFQNWTRVTADILGTVTFHADYHLPVEEVRAQLHRLLEEAEQWDGKVWGLQVTGAGDRTMELRALMSAPDASAAWDLRCAIREKMIDWLQAIYPECLPRVRGELVGEGSAPRHSGVLE